MGTKSGNDEEGLAIGGCVCTESERAWASVQKPEFLAIFIDSRIATCSVLLLEAEPKESGG